MKMLKYPCQGTHTTLCYVCECNTMCTMSMKKELCHFSSRQMTIFSREMKTFVNERNHRKMKEILQKGQSTHHPRIVIQQNTEVSDAPDEHHALDPRVGHVTTCQ